MPDVTDLEIAAASSEASASPTVNAAHHLDIPAIVGGLLGLMGFLL